MIMEDHITNTFYAAICSVVSWCNAGNSGRLLYLQYRDTTCRQFIVILGCNAGNNGRSAYLL